MQPTMDIALSYEENLNNHKQLRRAPVMSTLAGKLQARRKGCEPLADKLILNRFVYMLGHEEWLAPSPDRPRFCRLRCDVAPVSPDTAYPRCNASRRRACSAWCCLNSIGDIIFSAECGWIRL